MTNLRLAIGSLLLSAFASSLCSQTCVQHVSVQSAQQLLDTASKAFLAIAE